MIAWKGNVFGAGLEITRTVHLEIQYYLLYVSIFFFYLKEDRRVKQSVL